MAQLPDCQFELQEITTLGDRDKQRSLWDNVPGDFFTRDIDEQLLAGQADIAIHSAKDLPYPLPAAPTPFSVSCLTNTRA